jgi:hypothetical protein
VVKDDSKAAQKSFVPAKGSVPVNMKNELVNEKIFEIFKIKEL